MQLKRLEIDRYIPYILGRATHDHSHLTIRSKQGRLHQLVKELGLKPSEVMCIGDSREEIEIAKELGYVSVGICGGCFSVKRLKAAKPDYLIKNLSEIKTILSKFKSPP
jgi:phosphoglycolate phosphatase-like HAD superfamily hydrolase